MSRMFNPNFWRAGQRRELSNEEKSVLRDPKYEGPVEWDDLGFTFDRDYEENRSLYETLNVQKIDQYPLLSWSHRTGRPMPYHFEFMYGVPEGTPAREVVKHSPNMPGLIVNAPFKLSKVPLTNASKNEGVSIFKVMGITEIGVMIFKLLPYRARANYSQTCISGMTTASSLTTFGDLSNGGFNHSEWTQDEWDGMMAKGIVTPEDDLRRGLGELVVIAPTHLGLDEVLLAKGRYVQKKNTFAQLALNFCKMVRSLHNFGPTVRMLSLVRITFLDPMVLGSILKLTPNLENLEVLNCPQIRLDMSWVKLMDAIYEWQISTGKRLQFDGAPYYHLGAPMGGFCHTGTYGFTFNDSGVRVGTAFAKIMLHHLLPAIKKAEQWHMMRIEASFRGYLERLPLYDMCIPELMALFEWRQNFDTLDRKMTTEEAINWHMGVAHSAYGKGIWLQSHIEGPRLSNLQMKRSTYCRATCIMTCVDCKMEMPTYFFSVGAMCDACRLLEAYLGEADNYKVSKRTITAELGAGTIDDDGFKDPEDVFGFGALEKAVSECGGDLDAALRRPDSKLRAFVAKAEAVDAQKAVVPPWEPMQRPHEDEEAPGPFDDRIPGAALRNRQQVLQSKGYRRAANIEYIAAHRKGFEHREQYQW